MASIFDQLEDICVGLTSSKVSERKRCADLISDLIDNLDIVNYLNKTDSDEVSWNSLVKSIHVYLMKEAEKLQKDEHKKKSNNIYRKTGHDLLTTTIRKANNGMPKLTVGSLIQYVLYCFESPSLKKYFSKGYIIVLRDYILSESHYYGQIEEEEWISLLNLLKSFFNDTPNEDSKAIQCLELLLKWGPMHKLPLFRLRSEFPFVTKLCVDLMNSSPIAHQESVLKIVLEFCVQNAKDCCMACCKLGETVFPNLRSLYDVHANDGIKELLLELFLLQVKLHHPNGSLQEDTSAYACSWPEWNKQIRAMYCIFQNEISSNMRSSFRARKMHSALISLAVEVLKQVLSSGIDNMTQMSGLNSSMMSPTPSTKKPRLEVGLAAIISDIQDGKSWHWINVLTELLKKHPALMSSQDFTRLLQVLCNLQSECKDADMQRHIYECLSVLIDVEKYLDVSSEHSELQLIWSVIWDSALRSAGLNQNISATHKLLQALISARKTQNSLQLFETYVSGVLTVTKQSLLTLAKAASCFNIPEVVGNNVPSRKKFLHWILSTDNEKYQNNDVFSEEITAEVLVLLCLKQWPQCFSSETCHKNRRNSFDVEDVYMINACELDLILPEKKTKLQENISKTYLINREILDELLFLLQCVASQNVEASDEAALIKHSLNTLVLICNTLSHLTKYKVVDCDDKLTELVTRFNFEKMVVDASEVMLQKLDAQPHDERFLTSFVQHFNVLLSVNVCPLVAAKIRECVPVELLRKCFSLTESKEARTDYLRLLCMQTLCNFCCVKGTNALSDLQRRTLNLLSQPNCNTDNVTDYKMVMVLMNSVKNCEPATLPDDVLNNVIDSLQEVCKVRYTEYVAVMDILTVFHDLLPHIVSSNDIGIKEHASMLLEKFYELKDNYGPNVSVALIKCMGQISKVDPLGSWSRWSSQPVSCFLPDFLKSNHEEVRLTAIKHLLAIFVPKSCNYSWDLQKQIFNGIQQKSREVFRIQAEAISEEQIVDETVTRTASVLHTYASLMAVSSAWRQRFLYAVMEVVHEKQLDTKLLRKLLGKVAQYLKAGSFETFFAEYVDYVLVQWHRKYPVAAFPYALLDCSSEMEFYSKYEEVIVPLLVYDENIETLMAVALYKGKSVSEVVEGSYPKMMASCLLQAPGCNTHGATVSNEADGSKTYGVLEKLLSNVDMNEVLSNKVDYVIIDMLRSVYDADEFKKQFCIEYDVSQGDELQFSVAQFKNALCVIEHKLSTRSTIIEHCVANSPNKIQNVMLNLTVDIHKATGTENKLKALHHYATFVDLVVPLLLVKKKELKGFLIKSISYTLLHLISESDCAEENSTIQVSACKFFANFCLKILPDCAEILKNCLITIVNKLIAATGVDGDLGGESLRLLRFLIVENADDFKEVIELLDPFPQCESFREINDVYTGVKYKNDAHDLSYEIKQFLKAGELMGNIRCRTEALRHLQLQLAKGKNELARLYGKLQDTRGFSEDCKDSVLHQLISMLVRLATSSDASVSVEATRCLGELGPCDLTTIILLPENTPEDLKGKAIQFVTVHVIKLLSEYLVDADIEAVQVSSRALYDVLDTKEGKVFIDTCKDYSNQEIDTSYLIPFLTKRRIRSDSHVEIDVDLFKREIDREELWYPEHSHDTWIRNLVCSLLKCFTHKSYLSKLVPVCEIKVSFCEELLPYLIYLIVFNAIPSCLNILSNQMDGFFAKVWKLMSESEHVDMIGKPTVQCMLHVVHFIRIQTSVNKKNKGQLSLNYLKVARAACFCSAYFAALLYVELWCQATIAKMRNSGKNVGAGLTMLDVICENERDDTCVALQGVLRQVYTALGDLDALSGCGSMHLLDTHTRIHHYKQLGKWEQVTLHYDVQAANSSKEYVPHLTDALKNCGLYQLALDYNSAKGDVDYECFWRLNKYGDDHTLRQSGGDDGTGEKFKYEALKSLHENDNASFGEAITNARRVIVQSLRCASLESTKSFYSLLAQLQSLLELEEFYAAKEEQSLDDVLAKWKRQDAVSKCDFKYAEPIKAQRISMLAGLFKSENLQAKNFLAELYLDLATIARSESHFNVAKRALDNLSLLPDLSDECNGYKLLEEARICWSTNDKSTGRYIIHHLFNNNKQNLRLYFAALNLYGKWMAETKSENPQTILTNYFLESLKVMKEVDKTQNDCEDIFETYNVLARFVDAQYQRILAYIKSSEFERKVQNMDKSRTTASKIEAQCRGHPNDDEKRAILMYKRQSAIDETEINSTYKEKNTYFILAMKYYLLNLEYTDTHNTRIFRIISLWLENRNNTDLPKLLKDHLTKIPSYKYVPMLPQLVPHLSNSNDEDFGSQIYEILERCSREHPHHTLPILLALANSNKDDSYCKDTTNTESNEPRVLGANKLLENLKKDVVLKKVISNMDTLCQALIELAYISKTICSTDRQNVFIIPDRAKIMKIKNFTDVLLPTHTLAIRNNCNYSDIVGVQSFGREFAIVGGVNEPKRITCRGTDGINRTQLVKPQDDLRQDAVMQQVFTIMNGLLRTNKQTSKLLIRTYKVIPLSKRSGVIEWVENSMPLGEYLVFAHRKYNAGDWSADECKENIRNIMRGSNDAKLAKFKEICKNFRPIMHKFFETNFPQPTVWYERRRAYMHSVATSSMCGYILGLGDRHVQNILIDRTTAEVIHIDFGIAFEQGRILPTPETVPFRLTRDIENGMGVSGIEGVFRRSCEKTMEVLRQNSETISTIVEVLLYDPLYAWTITPAQAYSRQFSSDTDGDADQAIHFSEEDKTPVNVSAERALLKLRQKLQGTEEGSTSSVEGQVEKLLQEARDFANLSRLYFGWQAYL